MKKTTRARHPRQQKQHEEEWMGDEGEKIEIEIELGIETATATVTEHWNCH